MYVKELKINWSWRLVKVVIVNGGLAFRNLHFWGGLITENGIKLWVLWALGKSDKHGSENWWYENVWIKKIKKLPVR